MSFTADKHVQRPCGLYVRALSFKLALEHNGLVKDMEGMIEVKYPRSISRDCLPGIKNSREYLIEDKCLHENAGLFDQVPSGKGSNLIWVFSDYPLNPQNNISDHGYRLIAQKKLMQKDLTESDSFLNRDDLPVNVTVEKNKEATFSFAKGTEKAQSFKYSVLLDKSIVARAEVIVVSTRIAFISKMYTQLNCRQQGYATALLKSITRGLEKYAVEKIVLIPSPMTTEIKFYERFGFKDEKFILVFNKKMSVIFSQQG